MIEAMDNFDDLMLRSWESLRLYQSGEGSEIRNHQNFKLTMSSSYLWESYWGENFVVDNC